jgi:RHS repeat-associated protein
VQQYVFGVYIDEPLVMDRNLDGGATATGPGDQRLFYDQNTMYSVYALTDVASKIVEAYQYDAYGRQTVFSPGTNGVVDFGGDDVVTTGGTTNVNNPWTYTGRRLDFETSHYYYRTRYLDPVMGRFMSRDLIGIRGDLRNFGNVYEYSSDNPLNLVDPYGKIPAFVNCVLGCLFDDVRDLAKDLGAAFVADYATKGQLREAASKIIKEIIKKGGKAAVKRVIPALILADICWCSGWCAWDTDSYEPLFKEKKGT